MDEDLKRDFKGIWIPKEIWESKSLSPLEKIVFAEIDSLSGDNGCYATNDYLAEFCQCSADKISRTVSKLKTMGYLQTVSFNGRQRVVKSTMQACQKANADLVKSQGRLGEKSSRLNNTLNNRLNSIDNPPIAPQQFDEFWQAYPKKVGKKDALRMFNKAKVDFDVLMVALDKYKHSRKVREGYVMNPATWLNGEHWEDENEMSKLNESMDALNKWKEGKK